MYQVVLNALIGCATTMMLGLGFKLVLEGSRFFNFAHGLYFACGAYAALSANRLAVNPVSCLLVAVSVGALLGALSDIIVFRPLRQRGATPSTILIASLGIYTAGIGGLSLAYGDQHYTLRLFEFDSVVSVLGARASGPQVILIVTAALLYLGFLVLLDKTVLGKRLRAISDNALLARINGIPVEGIRLMAMIMAAATAALAGVLYSADLTIRPTMGMAPLMGAVVAVVVGGYAGLKGLLAASLLIGLAQNLVAFWIGNQWRDAIPFVVLVLFMIMPSTVSSRMGGGSRYD